MDFKKIFGTDKAKETDGTWVNIAPDVSIKVRRAGPRNKAFSFEQSKMLRPFLRQIQFGTIDPTIMREINAKLFAKHIITDWKGVLVDGKPLKFTPEKFQEFALEYPDFLNVVVEAASDLQNFQDGDDDELIKKPATSTATG